MKTWMFRKLNLLLTINKVTEVVELISATPILFYIDSMVSSYFYIKLISYNEFHSAEVWV